MFFTGFPDWQTTIDDVIAEGEQIVVRRTVQGTYKGEVQGAPVPPTGKLVTFKIWEMFRVSNGKIVERWAINDFGQQLSGTHEEMRVAFKLKQSLTTNPPVLAGFFVAQVDISNPPTLFSLPSSVKLKV